MYYLVIHKGYDGMYCKFNRRDKYGVYGYFQSVTESKIRTYEQVSLYDTILFMIPLEVIDG
jgi:hypothetical protein